MPNDIYEYENLQEIEYGGLKIIVEAARRDGAGNVIADTYAKKSEAQTSLRSGIDIITINNRSILTGENINLYNKTEIDSKFAAIRTIRFQIVDSLPTAGESNVIYLVAEPGASANGETVVNLYREYIYVDGKWELIGRKEDNLNFKTINGHRILVDGPNDSTNIQLNTGVQLLIVSELPEPETAEENTFYLIQRNGRYDMYGVVNDPSSRWLQLNEAPDTSEIESNIADLQDRVDDLENRQVVVDLTPVTDQIDALDDRITVLENKPEPTVTQTITKVSQLENDAGYLTAASLKSGYTELDDVDLDSIIVEGKYKITNATNYPVEGGDSGTLVVEEYNKELSEEWTSENIKAIRTSLITDVDMSFDSSLVINTVTHTESDVHLQPGGTYMLSGTLNGTVTVDAYPTGISQKEDTTIILNNVKISNKTATSTIKYLDESKKLIVVLKENTKNFLFNMLDEASNLLISDAVISSEHDLIITGTGGLSIRSNSGVHGMKGSEVTISGNPVIHVSAAHDCIHGSKLVDIQYGRILLEDGNDGIESKNSANTQGTVRITGGTITIRNCKSNSINSRLNGIACGPLTSLEFFNNAYPSNHMVFLEDITMHGESTQLTSFATYFGNPAVYEAVLGEDEDHNKIITHREELALSPNGDFYETMSGDQTLEIRGYMPASVAKRILCTQTKATILLNKVYIAFDGDGSTITYSQTSSRLSVRAMDDTVNYVYQTFNGTRSDGFDYDAIKSENNIELTGAGVLYATSVIEDAIDATDTSFKGDGPRYLINSGARGVKSTRIYFGGEKYTVSGSTASGGSDTADYTNIYALFNNTNLDFINNADIFCRNGKNFNKGNYTVWPGLKGVVVANTFKSVSQAPTADSAGQITHLEHPIYVRSGGTVLSNWVTLYDEVDSDELFSSKEITFTPWKIFFAIPTIANLDPSKDYVLGFSGGQIGWLSNINSHPPVIEDVIPANAVYDEDGNVFVDADGNYLVFGD